MEKIYPFSTKNSNKASFRIADILHQQQPDSQLLAQHLMMTKNEIKNSSKNSDLKNLSPTPKSPSSPTSLPETSSPEHAMKSDGTPMKPTPMYSNFPSLPFPLGIHPAFHPAAAYLNYAEAIHKG
jgi:hypothetical protein